jgi:hypothetical protein
MTVVCQPFTDTTSRCSPTAPVLPELRADVRDQILLVISEPVLSKKILCSDAGITDSHDGEEDGTWSRTFRDQLAPRGSACLTCASHHLGH